MLLQLGLAFMAAGGSLLGLGLLLILIAFLRWLLGHG
jgi:hypothetical protein